jgi:hypothetical protein
MPNTFSYVDYRKEMNLPDGIYKGRYNQEIAIIEFKEGLPVFVQLFKSSCWGGFIHSSIEILIPSQQIPILNH